MGGGGEGGGLGGLREQVNFILTQTKSPSQGDKSYPVLEGS